MCPGGISGAPLMGGHMRAGLRAAQPGALAAVGLRADLPSELMPAPSAVVGALPLGEDPRPASGCLLRVRNVIPRRQGERDTDFSPTSLKPESATHAADASGVTPPGAAARNQAEPQPLLHRASFIEDHRYRVGLNGY